MGLYQVAIVGSRYFQETEMVANYVIGLATQQLLSKRYSNDPVYYKIISGDAVGVDRTAQNCAKMLDLEVDIKIADWKKYGKSAGMIRNPDIIKDANLVIAFWDGKSNGTKNSIKIARTMNKHTVVYYSDGRKEEFIPSDDIEKFSLLDGM
jgi:hypothetical protein